MCSHARAISVDLIRGIPIVISAWYVDEPVLVARIVDLVCIFSINIPYGRDVVQAESHGTDILGKNEQWIAILLVFAHKTSTNDQVARSGPRAVQQFVKAHFRIKAA